MKIQKFISKLLGKRKVETNENLWTSTIHPLYVQMKENASVYLLQNGFSIFNEKDGNITFKNNSEFYITIINQGYDFPDVYIGTNDEKEEMIRFWFVLELYLTDKKELFKKHESMGNFYDFEYEKDFIATHYESILKTIQFPEKYKDWKKNN